MIFCYISPICPEALSGWICIIFGIGGPLVDVINCADFIVDHFRGVMRHFGPKTLRHRCRSVSRHFGTAFRNLHASSRQAITEH